MAIIVNGIVIFVILAGIVLLPAGFAALMGEVEIAKTILLWLGMLVSTAYIPFVVLTSMLIINDKEEEKGTK